MEIEYPPVKFQDIPSTNNVELLYWIYRTNQIRGPLEKLYLKLASYLPKNPTTIALLLAIIRRELELTDSIFMLAVKSRIKDVGVLILNLYELTLDLQYISLNPGSEDAWMYNESESKKPWRISELQKAIFKGDELTAEKSIFKEFSMIKHGNIAGKHIAFDVFIHDHKLVMAEASETSMLPTLFGINSLLYRATLAALKILSRFDIKEDNIFSEMNILHNKYGQTFRAVSELQVAELLHPDNLEMQNHFAEKAKAAIENDMLGAS
jgi:hypothetical protein